MKPSDICLTLASNTSGGWLSADEVRGRLERLGFEGYSAQQVSAWLRRLTRMEASPVESREGPWGGGYLEFRTTMYGRTWLSNLVSWTREWR